MRTAAGAGALRARGARRGARACGSFLGAACALRRKSPSTSGDNWPPPVERACDRCARPGACDRVCGACIAGEARVPKLGPGDGNSSLCSLSSMKIDVRCLYIVLQVWRWVLNWAVNPLRFGTPCSTPKRKMSWTDGGSTTKPQNLDICAIYSPSTIKRTKLGRQAGLAGESDLKQPMPHQGLVFWLLFYMLFSQVYHGGTYSINIIPKSKEAVNHSQLCG